MSEILRSLPTASNRGTDHDCAPSDLPYSQQRCCRHSQVGPWQSSPCTGADPDRHTYRHPYSTSLEHTQIQGHFQLGFQDGTQPGVLTVAGMRDLLPPCDILTEWEEAWGPPSPASLWFVENHDLKLQVEWQKPVDVGPCCPQPGCSLPSRGYVEDARFLVENARHRK